jgi:succinate dehydrogenase/fumarate reductase cytochrome b subunit
MQRVIESGVAQPQQVRVAPERGTIPWLLQRITAYGLLIFLAVHMWFNHFADVRNGSIITFEIVNRRFHLYPVLYALNDIGLLTCAVFHGMNGVRNVAYDLFTNSVLRKIITVVLIVVSLWALIDGSLTLLALMQLPTTAG